MNYDLLLHVDSPDPAILKLAFNNFDNYKAAIEDDEPYVIMVVNGPGVQNLTKDKSELAARGAELVAKGLNIRVCRNALNTFKISEEELWPCCQVIRAGMLEIVQRQRDGFAYVKP